MKKRLTDDLNVVLRMTLRYKGKDYICDAYCWYDEEIKEWRSGYEDDGVRNCEHDYADLLPDNVGVDTSFGCDQKYIEVIWYDFFDKKNNKIINRFNK